MNFYQNKQDNSIIKVKNVSRSFEKNLILKDISINLKKGEFVSILGPSGCGKSTLFNIITGIIKEDSGEVSVKGDLGYMQQKDLLLPWKTVMENVVLPLDIRGSNKRESRERAVKYIEIVGLKGYEKKYPYELSGGMRQRASFLRTFLSSEEIMLLDEPFGALDSITRGKMQRWILDMKQELKRSILFVTHDIEEAILLSDRIYVLSSKPGMIKKEINVDFENENKKNRIFSKKLLEMKADILKLL
ncbi:MULTISPECIES: ABC transporter ATP-binding protein [Clostridium]|nr:MULTISPECIES: ABC transporter ATP-binding protein [Clostridium]ADK13949.1 predicted ABC transporter, ATPase component [Clostridium ljungdahlii DSM 13528]AGY77179.2 ABC transporter ATP-binding protein [Clostridium autoethanogenum DSM 10061]RMC98448.1 ABC transporter ATP-binding protein [Clostridium autoethanogenum]